MAARTTVEHTSRQTQLHTFINTYNHSRPYSRETTPLKSKCGSACRPRQAVLDTGRVLAQDTSDIHRALKLLTDEDLTLSKLKSLLMTTAFFNIPAVQAKLDCESFWKSNVYKLLKGERQRRHPTCKPLSDRQRLHQPVSLRISSKSNGHQQSVNISLSQLDYKGGT